MLIFILTCTASDSGLTSCTESIMPPLDSISHMFVDDVTHPRNGEK